MAANFSAELKKVIQSYLTRYETKRSGILPILHAIQDEKDWISDADIDELEKSYGLSPVDVREVLTFYAMYRKSPPQPFRFHVCNSISCWLMGSQKTIAAIQQKIDSAKAAGKPIPFEVKAVECLGVCGYAPAAFINKDRHLNVTPELALKLVDEYCKKDIPAAGKRCAADLAASSQTRI